MPTIDDKPADLKDEHLEYLDDLRESGVTNMFGASPYLKEAFHLKEPVAVEILSYWMKTFSTRHRIKL